MKETQKTDNETAETVSKTEKEEDAVPVEETVRGKEKPSSTETVEFHPQPHAAASRAMSVSF